MLGRTFYFDPVFSRDEFLSLWMELGFVGQVDIITGSLILQIFANICAAFKFL